MPTQIRNRYEQESILYTFIRRYIIDWDVVQDFRQTAIRAIKDVNDTEFTTRLENFKENPSVFLQPQWAESIDMNEFKEVVNHIESFYEDKIPDFTQFRYYQYITLLITFIFCKLHTQKNFKTEYLHFISQEVLTQDSERDYSRHIDSTFNRLGYWMATASGKTLLMYAIVYMYTKLISSDIKTLYVLVPTDELRTQHTQFLNMFSNFGGSNKDSIININQMRLFDDNEINVKLTTLSKMTGDESGDNLDNNSIMIFDEAHKGAGSAKEDSATEKLKNKFIAKTNSFLFEFSATFQKAFEADKRRIGDLALRDKNIFDRYIFSSVFKYNLYDFNTDGFGKSYYVNNLSGANDTTEEGKRRLVCDSLVHFGLQLLAYTTIKQEISDFKDHGTYILHKDGTKLFQPLYMGLSWKLVDEAGTVDEKSGTSLVDILKNIRHIFSHYDEYIPYITEKTSALYKDELKIPDTVDPKKLYQLLTGIEYTKGKDILLQLWYDKQVDEIKLILGNKKMLINTGSNTKLAEVLKETIPDMFSLQEQFGTGGRWFNDIDNNEDILYVFGSKKFIEGWDSKRPSTIMLFKMGKGSTIVATQILGRGLRLAGKDGDGFRHIGKRLKHNAARNHHTYLTEFVGLFGYEIDEFKKFIDQISGDILYVRINKKRTFTPSFKQYLEDKGINLEDKGINLEDDKEVNKFLGKTFKYISQDIVATKEIIQGTYIKTDIEPGQINFSLAREKDKREYEKSIGVLKQSGHTLFSSRDTGVLADGAGALRENQQTTTNIYDYHGLSLLGERGVQVLTDRLHARYKERELDTNTRDSISGIISGLFLQTDSITKGQAEDLKYQFDIHLQTKIVSIFTNYVEELFARIDRHIKEMKEKEVMDNNLALNLDNFIDGLTINLGIKKSLQQYKIIQDAFKIDESTHQLEENYDDLSEEQKKIFDPLLITREKDLHFYERLYYIPLSSQRDGTHHLHEVNEDIKVDGTLVDLSDFVPEPIDMKLNYNEESRVEGILKNITADKTFETYDIFYLRNLVGASNGGIKFAYEEESGNLKYFFPDFLFWFIDRKTEEKTLVYFEPKSAIDPNWIRKNELLNKTIGRDIHPKIAELFDKASSGNETFWGGVKM